MVKTHRSNGAVSIGFTIEAMGRVLASRLELPITTAWAYVEAERMTLQDDIDAANERRFHQWLAHQRED